MQYFGLVNYQKYSLGYITPIYKKHGKPIHDPNSYRRITVTNIKSEMRSFKSNENIHKKEGGSYYVVSANKA